MNITVKLNLTQTGRSTTIYYCFHGKNNDCNIEPIMSVEVLRL